MLGVPTTACSLTHSLPYIFLKRNDAMPFYFDLSAGLVAHLRLHPSVPQYFGPVPLFNLFAGSFTGRCLSMQPSANHAEQWHRF